MIQKQESRISKVNSKGFLLYHLNNSSQLSQKLSSSYITKNCEQPLYINRKMQNMRHIVKKLQEIEKVSAFTKSPTNKRETNSSNNQAQQDNSYLVNKFIKSKRFMVTSSALSNQCKKNGVSEKVLRKKLKSNRKEDPLKVADDQFDKIQYLMRQKQKMIRFFEKTAINFRNKNNPFQPIRRVLSVHRPTPTWSENKQNFVKTIISK